jgi:hypothetical protein
MQHTAPVSIQDGFPKISQYAYPDILQDKGKGINLCQQALCNVDVFSNKSGQFRSTINLIIRLF